MESTSQLYCSFFWLHYPRTAKSRVTRLMYHNKVNIFGISENDQLFTGSQKFKAFLKADSRVRNFLKCLFLIGKIVR